MDAFTHNLKSIVSYMRKHDIGEIMVSYSGDGDSGQVDSVMVDQTDIESLKGHDEKVIGFMTSEAISTLDENMAYQTAAVMKVEKTTLERAVMAFYDMAMTDCGHDGYENNDGGSGTFAIRSDGTCYLDHDDDYTDSSQVESVDVPRDRLPQCALDLLAFMTANGIKQASYNWNPSAVKTDGTAINPGEIQVRIENGVPVTLGHLISETADTIIDNEDFGIDEDDGYVEFVISDNGDVTLDKSEYSTESNNSYHDWTVAEYVEQLEQSKPRKKASMAI